MHRCGPRGRPGLTVAVVLALVALVVAGVPVAYAVTRHVVVAAVLAPLVTALQCTVAAVAMVLVGGPFGVWLAIATLASWGSAALVVRRPRPAMPSLGVVDVAVMYVPLLLPALLVRRPPVAWDARSIWWFHASWIEGDSDAFRDALANPALAYSHPDYPPLVPATIAGAWTSTGGSGLWIAQAVSTVLTLSAVAMLAYAVRHLVPTARPMVARLLALGVALGLWATADYGIAAGYVDHLWAAALAGAVVLLFIDGSIVGADGRSGSGHGGHLALAVLLATVAALTKNEGMVAAVIVAVLFTVRARHRLRRAAWMWLPVAAGLVWAMVARGFGATSDLSSSPRIGQLTSGDLEPLGRIPRTLTTFGGHVGWVLAGTLVVSVVGAVTLRRSRRSMGLVSAVWPWLVIVGFGVGLLATYVISPYDIGWHLATSADRVGVLLLLVALAVVASWVLVALAPAETTEQPPPPKARERRIDADLPSERVRVGW